MRLPNADQAVIDPQKLHGYLLSVFHPVGRLRRGQTAGGGNWLQTLSARRSTRQGLFRTSSNGSPSKLTNSRSVLFSRHLKRLLLRLRRRDAMTTMSWTQSLK